MAISTEMIGSLAGGGKPLVVESRGTTPVTKMIGVPGQHYAFLSFYVTYPSNTQTRVNGVRLESDTVAFSHTFEGPIQYEYTSTNSTRRSVVALIPVDVA